MTTQLEKFPWADERLADPVDSDVCLSGSGIGVDLLATILARGGLRVTVSDEAGAAPVAVTTVPYTAELMFLLADRFAVPELADLAMYGRLPAWLQASSGIKQSLGFVYHRANRAHDRAENVQFSVPGEHAEWHAYLPDIQRHTRKLAQRYGVRYAASPPAAGTGLAVTCTGTSPDAPARLAGTAIFDGVTPFEQSRPPKDDGYTQPWSEGSTVHGFRGGWVQVAAFGNHPDATNTGCAVSVSVPAEAGRDCGGDLDTVLARLCQRYPDLGLQLRGASRHGPWSQTGVPASDRPPGDALVLELSLGRGEVLFGQDFTLLLELVHASAAILLAPGALASPAARAESVRAIERFQQSLLGYAEDFAAAGRIATQGFESWNAYLRAWLLWSISSALALKKVRLDAVRSGDWVEASHFDRGMEWFALAPGIAGTVTACAAATRAIAEQSVPPRVAAGRVFALLSRRRIIPPFYKFGTPAARRYRLNLATRLKVLVWTFTVAPKAYRGMLTADNITAVPDEGAH
jgi:FADH2 O2-dependent halogenase